MSQYGDQGYQIQQSGGQQIQAPRRRSRVETYGQQADVQPQMQPQQQAQPQSAYAARQEDPRLRQQQEYAQYQQQAYRQQAYARQPYQQPQAQQTQVPPQRPVSAPVPPQRPVTPAPVAQPAQFSSQNIVVNVNAGAGQTGESYFDGGLLQQIGYAILGALITMFTLGICFPWAMCMQYGWKINHTVIQGRRLRFDGKATQLFGKWLLWMLLCVITFGIYSLWLGIALEKWRVKHTHFAD